MPERDLFPRQEEINELQPNQASEPVVQSPSKVERQNPFQLVQDKIQISRNSFKDYLRSVLPFKAESSESRADKTAESQVQSPYVEEVSKPQPGLIPASETRSLHEVEKQNRTQLVQDKIQASRNLARDYLNSIPGKNYGRVVNLHLIGKLLAHSLYSPGQSFKSDEHLDEYMEAHPESAKDFAILNEPIAVLELVNNNEVVKSRGQGIDNERFAGEFGHVASRHNLPRRPEYENKTYSEVVHFNGAIGEIKELLSLGPVEVWTAGDTNGLPDEDLRGNNEQYKRAIQGGLNELKREYQDEKHKHKLGIQASENKFGLLKSMVSNFDSAGVRQYVVVDDKISNLEEAKMNLIRLGIHEEDVLLIWDRQGIGALGSDKKIPKGIKPEEIPALEKKYHAISNIKDLHFTIIDNTPLINLDNPIGTIIDHDDVISNTQKAAQIVGENIMDWLEEKRVI